MFYHLFSFQFPSLGWAGNPSACTIRLCSASSERSQSLWLHSKKPTWRGLSWGRNGEDSGRELSCPAPTSCAWWQCWPAEDLSQLPRRNGGTATDLRFWSKASSHLCSFSEAGLCVFFLDEMTLITHLIYSPLFLTLIKTTLWDLKCWLSDWERGNTNKTIMIMKWKVHQYEQSCTSVLSKTFNLRSAINSTIDFMSQNHEGRTKRTGRGKKRKEN